MSKRKSKQPKCDGVMDKECIALCDAINTLPGIRTIHSCCGHGRQPFRIWLMARFLSALPPLATCLSEYRGWRCTVETGDPVCFLIEGPTGAQAYREAKEIAKDMKWWARRADIQFNTECLRRVWGDVTKQFKAYEQ